MVVAKHQGDGIQLECPLQNDSWICNCAGNTAPADDLKFFHLIGIIEKEHCENFMLIILQLGLKI